MFAFVQALQAPPVSRFVIIFGRVHVLQNDPVRIEEAPPALVDNFQAKFLDCVGDLPHAVRKRGRDGRAALTTINRGEWLDPALGSRNDDPAPESEVLAKAASRAMPRRGTAGRRQRSDSRASALQPKRWRFLPDW
jgi:hypothetical protein